MTGRSDLRYVRATFEALPGWNADDHLAAFKAFLKSCPEAARGRSSDATDASAALAAACAAAVALAKRGLSRSTARAFFEAHFLPHRLEHGGPEGLLTGYYEPLLDGSRTPTARFHVPVLRRPADLVTVVDDAMRGAVGATLTHARRIGRRLEPYPTRAEIEAGALAGRGLELVYLADPVEAFFLHVQGSGRIRLPDGTSIRVSYDGKNGHPYTSIGRHLIESGAMGAERMSLQALARWLRADPERGRATMWMNASYVFFRELAGPEAASALGVNDIPLTAGRSMAVDAGHHALGSPIYVVAPAVRYGRAATPLRRLMIAQDVGSAITGPERGDIYFGSGREAGRHAGRTKHPGTFYVLLARADAGRPAARSKARRP